jgi:phosphate-selective porin OprO and OprP
MQMILMAVTVLAGQSVGLAEQEGVRASSDEVRAIVAEMLADAETRTSLLAEGAVAGHDGRFFVASADGNFRLNIGGQMQFRYHLNFRDDEGGDEEFESGFQTARTKLYFAGHVVTPNLTYRVQTNFDRGSGDAILEDAYVGYQWSNGWSIKAGQAFPQFMREWFMGDAKMQLLDRSVTAFMFGQQREQFVELRFENDDFRASVNVSDGFRSQNTDFTSDPADFATTARFDYKFGGKWGQFDSEYTSKRGSDFAGVIGAAAHYEIGQNDDAGDEQQLIAWTADTLLKGDGWNVLVTGVGYHVRDEAGVSGADFDDFGVMAQGAVFITDDVDVFARYDLIIPDSERAADGEFNVITAGCNWYWSGQAAKFTLQAAWYLDPTTDTTAGNFGGAGGRTPDTGGRLVGLLPSSEDDQIVFSMQFQLLF